MLEKQHSLLKLIIQKMEITSEAEEYDGPVNLKGNSWKSLVQPQPRSASKWFPLIKAIGSRRKC